MARQIFGSLICCRRVSLAKCFPRTFSPPGGISIINKVTTYSFQNDSFDVQCPYKGKGFRIMEKLRFLGGNI